MANARQMKIVGTERDKSTIFKDVEDAAAHYVDVRDKRMALSKEEIAAKEALVVAMKAHKLPEYVCDEIEQRVIFEKETVTNVKVKKLETAEPEAEDEST